MAKKIVQQTPIREIVNFLSHPAWNGITCFFTALATFAAFGLGSVVLAYVLGLMSRIQGLSTWLSEPLSTPKYLLVGGLIVLLALVATIAHQHLSSRHQLISRPKRNKVLKNKLEPTFVPLSLPTGIGNSYFETRFINPPSGNIILGGVKFQLEPKSLVFDTNEQIRYLTPRDDGSKEVDFRLPRPINQIRSTYFLINSGNSKNLYNNEKIGEIRLIFKDAPPIVTELVLGYNIREWCPGNPGDFVRETSSPDVIADVWKGLSKNGANAVIDCLKVPNFECMRGNFLEKIIFVHRPTKRPPDTMGVHFTVFAVSLEIEHGI